MTDEFQKQLISDLLVESFDGLDRFDQELLVLEQGKGDAETMNVIFRVIHSMKGTAGCVGLSRIESLAHAGENLLSLLREGQLTVSGDIISGLFALSDGLRSILRQLESTGAEGVGENSVLIDRLQALQAGGPPSLAAPAASAVFGLFDDAPLVPVPASAQAVDAEPPTRSAAENGIRVDVGQLDKLMNLVGELVLARNQIVQNAGRQDSAALQTASQRLNHITTELQESVMKTRMQPIGNVWAKFPRVVRDVATDLKKKVHLEMLGSETELDRTIIEAIKDPLTHIIRNAIDHGIELPADRERKGKPAQGNITLRAFHEGGQVNIEISEDGAGINLERVKQKAIERGLVSAEQAGRMSDREAQNLVFAAGLSTAEKVTNLSGRGVGMDVVKTNIEKIGGSIDLKSERDRGTTLRIKIPLTLAIIPALIISTAGERFAIPQVNLLELVRLEADQAATAIENLAGVPVYRLRGQLLSLCHLARELGLPDQPAADVINIVVLQADGRVFGLVVDEINDSEEIVVKPLGKQLKGLSCFAGATIMGDGKVALILDVIGLAQRANVIGEASEESRRDDAEKAKDGAPRQQLLILESGGRRLAVPLSAVARLEEISRARVERSGDQAVMQYRGDIIPLTGIDWLTVRDADAPDPMQVVVYAENGRQVGMVVDRVSDIVEQVVDLRREAADGSILGSLVVQGRVTDLLDVSALFRSLELAAEPVAALS